jgi:hypothetical protein
MPPDELRGLLRRQPFQPLRLTLADGRTYKITHPRLAIVGKSILALGLTRPGDPEDIYDRLVMVDLDQIEHVESLEPITPPPGL